MFGRKLILNENTLGLIEEIGKHIPGGFFIYKAQAPEELIYANDRVLSIFGCENQEQFRELTGFTFRGMVHPDDYEAIVKSINYQIENGTDNNDYAEYRIIRRDGKIRWIDDYGHYTETENYGGIYYVFISDITERKELIDAELENAHKKEGFAHLMGSVASLFVNMPAMSFSKDAQTGIYLACNQSFAEYAHKGSPEEVVGLTDYEIFDSVTAKHFVDDDRKAIEMDEPFVFFEDVPDAVGNPRSFQTTKSKFKDENGRLCTLGMCVDVTEMSRIKGREAEARVKQEELMQRLSLQEKLVDEARHREQQSKLITALSSDYRSVYYIELDTDYGICYQEHTMIGDGVGLGEEFRFSEVFNRYAENYVTSSYRDKFREYISPDNIRAGLEKSRVISFTYLVERDGEQSYESLRFAGVRHPEDRDDHIVHTVGACFVDVDTETRKNMEQSEILNEALDVARNANNAKTAFLSNMSHEIRTPMNAIIGLNSIALNDPSTPDETKQYLNKIGSSAHHLMNIINDILDMSRIESGRMVIKDAEFSFANMLEQVNTMIGGQCSDKGINYECRIKGHVNDYYIGDDMKLRQVLINILGNAVKFTPEGGSITFIIEETARFSGKTTLKFIISDTGIGMSREYLPKIFDTFSQENSAQTNKYGSTGLGMSITKSIVELMNGTISVDSVKGEGTTFTVSITFTDSQRKTGEDRGEEDGALPSEMHVLVIDDDPIACEHAQIILGQVGVSCDSATSGEEGLSMVKMHHVRREPYNLILVDWKMPGLDGVETTRRIRDEIDEDTPVIILTSYNWEEIADDARIAGVDSFVRKPLFASSVMDEFRTAFKNKNSKLIKEKTNLDGKRILLAEDMQVNAEIMSMILSVRNMEVDHAENGQEAVRFFEGHEEGYYSAILMDMRMPVMDGLEATRVIRGLGRSDSETIPIIALTANAFDEDVQQSMQAGLNAHLSKPVEPEILYDTLTSLIK